MLLTLWVVLSTAGIATFLLGHLLGFPGVASIGAVMVMLVGGEVVLDGLHVKDGEEIERQFTTVENETVENRTMINDTYQSHSWTERFTSDNALGLGVFQLLIGVLLFYQEMLTLTD